MIAPLKAAQVRLGEPIPSVASPTVLGERRIIVLINSLGGGGSERSLVELIPFYRAAGIEPVVVCLKRREGDLEELLREAKFRILYLRGDRIPAWVLSLRKLMALERVALVHTSLFEADVVGRVAAFRTGVPVLTDRKSVV